MFTKPILKPIYFWLKPMPSKEAERLNQMFQSFPKDPPGTPHDYAAERAANAKRPIPIPPKGFTVEEVCFGGIDGERITPPNPNGKTIQQLLPSDPYKEDYDGMRIIRLIFPAEAYKNETLYFTVYYEKDGVEYVWAYYPVCIKSNEYWTLR